MWDERRINILFHTHADMEEGFNKAKTHTQLWNQVRQRLVAVGCNVTPLQFMKKWKTLKKDL